MHRATNSSCTSGRAVIVPPITINSTFSTRDQGSQTAPAGHAPARTGHNDVHGPVLPRVLPRYNSGENETGDPAPRAGKTFAMRAGIRGSHHRNRRHTRKCPGWLHQQDLPQCLMLLFCCSGKDGRIFRHRRHAYFLHTSIFTATIASSPGGKEMMREMISRNANSSSITLNVRLRPESMRLQSRENSSPHARGDYH